MAFNIKDMTSAINRRGGLAKPSHFYVMISKVPKALQGMSYPKEAHFFCDTAALPGFNFSTQTVKPIGYGNSENRPHDTSFNPVEMSFLVDSDGKVLDFFQKWISMVYNFSIDQSGVMQGSNLAYGEFAYPEEYEGVIEIHFLDPVGGPNGREIMKYTLTRAFPMTLGNINVGWEQNDTLTRLPVAFAYNNWDTKAIPASTMDSAEAQRLQASNNAENRFNAGGSFAFGLNLLQNGRRNPSALISGIDAFASSLR